VGGEIPVAKAEPVRAGAVSGKLRQHGEGLPGPPPALLLADPAAERVHDRVKVRADVQSEQRDVVAGVADDGDLGFRCGRHEAAQETCAADAAGQNGDAHAGSLPGRSERPLRGEPAACCDAGGPRCRERRPAAPGFG
jgi:hypothetical protein